MDLHDIYSSHLNRDVEFDNSSWTNNVALMLASGPVGPEFTSCAVYTYGSHAKGIQTQSDSPVRAYVIKKDH